MVIYAINSQADAAARLVMVVPGLAQSLLSLIGMFWILLIINWQLAVLSLTVVPFLYFSVGYYVKNIKTRLYEVRGMEGELLSIIHEAMSMLRVIVAFGRETTNTAGTARSANGPLTARVRLTVRQTLFSWPSIRSRPFGTALVLGVGAYQPCRGGSRPGQLLVVMSYVALVYKPLETISSTVGSLQELFVKSAGVRSTCSIPCPKSRTRPWRWEIDRARGYVQYEGVSFSYRRRKDTLTDISFEAQARTGGGDRRPNRGGEVHACQPAATVLRRPIWPGAAG